MRIVVEGPCDSSLNRRARARLQQGRGETLFVADWEKVLMIHFAVDSVRLQREVPFELDLREGGAFVTLVAFTMRGMRPARGGRLNAWLFRPIATHDFLNVRTYVRVGEDCGIHFLAEWVSNRMAAVLGPLIFSLPYRKGILRYANDGTAGTIRGRVEDGRTGAAFAYRAALERAPFSPCRAGSVDEWLMERYSAFNSVDDRQRFFRVWHEPWSQCKAHVELVDTTLLEFHWGWFHDAMLTGVNYSPCARDVRLGRPHCVDTASGVLGWQR